MTTTTFTATEVAQIIADAGPVYAHLAYLQEHLNATGTVVPMRTLGFWEHMILDQHALALREMAPALNLATALPEED
jgi:hypothetical protein